MGCWRIVLTFLKIPLNILLRAPKTHNHVRVKRRAIKVIAVASLPV